MSSSNFSSPIDTGLALQPDITFLQIQSGAPEIPLLIYQEILKIYNAIRRIQQAVSFDTVSGPLTSTGTTQSDATVLGKVINIFTTVASGTGAVLQGQGTGSSEVVKNFGANPLSIYPPAGGQIDNLATNAPLIVAVGDGVIFFAYNDTSYISIKGA